LFLSACSVPHNDVLIFGTNTKFAVDVSASAATGGVPELTVGYKRQEAVWMPLLVNGQLSQAVQMVNRFYNDCFNNAITEATKKTCRDDYVAAIDTIGLTEQDLIKYIGEAEGSGHFVTGGDRATKGEKDAYSVFASFGARFRASGGTGKSEAQGSIAQFFATGIAAQRLGANAKIGDALKVESTSEKTEKALKAQADAEKARADSAATQAEFYSNLTPAELETIRKRAVDNVALRRQENRQIANCSLPDGSPSRAQALIDAAEGLEAKVGNIKADFLAKAGEGKQALIDLLNDERDTATRRALNEARKTLCPL